MRPMLATPGTDVPVGGAWLHEVKWDGMRILADGPRLFSRNGNDVTVSWPDVAGGSTELRRGRDHLVDGEIIALNGSGRPDFRTLQERIHIHNPTTAARLADRLPVTFMVFDLLRLDGRDLTSLPLAERRARLSDLDLGSWQVPASYDDGPLLHLATREQGLEGIVSKRRDSVYRFDIRSPHWLKFAHRYRDSYVVGGWRRQEGASNGRLAALLVGEPTRDGLLYRGRVGSGIGGVASRRLTDMLAPYRSALSPFADEVPRIDALGTTWVEPVLVVDVDTHGVGYERLRQPSYRGVRTDLTPAQVLARRLEDEEQT